MTPTPIVIAIAVIVMVVLAVAFFVMRKRTQEANLARAEKLRTHAAAQAQDTLPPAQARAAEAERKAADAEAKAAETRAVADHAQAEADEARLTAARAEAEHEAQLRAADRLDPRVDHKSDDYAPQVGGTVDQQPAPPPEGNRETGTPADVDTTGPGTTDIDTTDRDTTDAGTTDTGTQPAGTSADSTPLLPRRTPGANEMPGKPMESDGTSGGWFTRKDSDRS